MISRFFKNNVVYVLATIAIALISGFVYLRLMPYRLLEAETDKYLAEAGGYHRFIHNPPSDHNWKKFVRPCPDFLYSIVVYNLEKAPLAIDIPAHSSYWTYQFVADNTDSYKYIGPRTEGGKASKYVLFGPETPKKELPKGYKRIDSPSNTGAILARYLIKNPGEVTTTDRIRKEARVRELK